MRGRIEKLHGLTGVIKKLLLEFFVTVCVEMSLLLVYSCHD